MIRSVLSLFAPSFSNSIVYMLQNVEYMPAPYLTWLWRAENFNQVMKRRTLDRTRAARLLLLVLTSGILLQSFIGIVLIVLGARRDYNLQLLLGTVLVISAPILWAHLIVLPLLVGRIFIVRPREHRLIRESKQIFMNHPAIKIAVAGSYGKTTVKELLTTVLSEGRVVRATPGNKNVAVSHAQFAKNLTGNEEILIIEYGEGRPGDVQTFVQTTRPDMVIITGIAPAHLDQYPTLESAARDIFSATSSVAPEKVIVNGDSALARPYIGKGYQEYSALHVFNWKISGIKVSIGGTQFAMDNGKEIMSLNTKLLGRHLVGSVGLAAALAREQGFSVEQVQAGVSKTRPYEHRMQPCALAGGWIIDDTYNGNIEGIRAGLALLAELPAARKTYVTPGLVDQGAETEKVHRQIGTMIGETKPDKVVLMNNSVTPFIMTGIEATGYKPEVQIEHDPLRFYTNLEHYVAAGDIVLMQNDWTDNYK